VLFEGTSRYSPYFDVAADGQRILTIKRPPKTQGARRSGDRGVDWFEQLGRRMPGEK
jgi:hypothetical protein